MELKDRIVRFIESENITPSVFADEIGVQRSSVSHILSGRNNPGFDFLQKILIRYRNLSADWLMMGIGDMYKSTQKSTLFEIESAKAVDTNTKAIEPLEIKEKTHTTSINTEEKLTVKPLNNRKIEKVIIFYADKTFSQYTSED